MIEPNCDMPWEIYLDWLEDQGCTDLRFIDPSAFTTGQFSVSSHQIWEYCCSDGIGDSDFLTPNARTTKPSGEGELIVMYNPKLYRGGGYHDGYSLNGYDNANHSCGHGLCYMRIEDAGTEL